MTCPKCGSENIRPSRHRKWSDLFRATTGREAFRCRRCHERFYATGSESATVILQRRFRKRGSKRVQRLLLQAVIGVVLLLIFYVFLHYLTREPSPANDSGALLRCHEVA